MSIFKSIVNNIVTNKQNPYKDHDPETANGDHDTLTHTLHRTLDVGSISEKDKRHLVFYTGGHSKNLNRALIEDRPSNLNGESRLSHSAMSEHMKPIGVDYHVYSGTGRDFSKIMKGAGDTLHSPAYISTSHSFDVAKGFAKGKSPSTKSPHIPLHYIHIHVKPHNKALYAAGYSNFGHEKETIIPEGTTLKYHGSTQRRVNNDDQNHHIHHFTIEHQAESKSDHAWNKNKHLEAVDHNENVVGGMWGGSRVLLKEKMSTEFHNNTHPDLEPHLKRHRLSYANSDHHGFRNAMAHGEELDGRELNIHHAITSSVRPASVEHHIFGENIKHPKSGTHEVDHHFLGHIDDGRALFGDPEISHIHIKEGDHVVNTGEGTTTLPKGTKLKHNGTSVDSNTNATIHHYEIER